MSPGPAQNQNYRINFQPGMVVEVAMVCHCAKEEAGRVNMTSGQRCVRLVSTPKEQHGGR